ncbi:DUF3150 domain-containing protein [Enterobacter hormaechei]|uniref:DUF3150 domain-containing protein n=1 Tax=Enterobacter hormaechei subsp. steigerwaltii TaxID=299766 RepID=A0AAX3AHH5_9ENTR|nr:DUF3150 domain-containing protein [Enterobacter hormaechei]MCC9335660.1 DUF3150 domain-containing protein [Enterobacter hormaechei subsp. steigerwaltii]MCC9345263.1 DUF3150 domain-containing protein [Enterobacter hormaechei subsp. steigerwaltii]MCC9350238.1 DUF3150 domain-containing protein [Enterobacter hormaechei subsp. steigerwaltii]MCC9365647.1 DUF3150 domain-containing protein [Enterobacter hormaechei subsp. steigerwaltii]MCC9375445.1 DUF3150 domain-containing protein [Enterobacter hor
MTLNTSMLNKVSAKQISENFAKSYPDLLEGAVITKIEISGCQGSRRTDKIDLSYDGDDITDQKSVSKSEVRWIDIKALSFKSTITSRISTLCSRLCIRYSNMWILPVSSMEEFLEGAQEIEREFQAGIQNVVDNYEMHIEAEKNRSPRMSSLIDQLKLTKDDFIKSFRFNIAHFIPFTPISVEGDETQDYYQEQLITDLAEEAMRVYEKISKNNNFRSSTIDRLKQMQNKIISFMFIHKEAAVLAEAIKHIMNNLPKGAISEPRDVAVLQQWFYFMSDASMLKRIISGEQKVTDWLESITRSFNQSSQTEPNALQNTGIEAILDSTNVFQVEPVVENDIKNSTFSKTDSVAEPEKSVSQQEDNAENGFDIELKGW